MKLSSFQSAERVFPDSDRFFKVENDEGKAGVFDNDQGRLIVPCEFFAVYPGEVRSVWQVTVENRPHEVDHFLDGAYSVPDRKLVVPPVCRGVKALSPDLTLVMSRSCVHHNWTQFSVYIPSRRTLYSNLEHNEDVEALPRWKGQKRRHAAIPVFRDSGDSCVITLRGDKLTLTSKYGNDPEKFVFSRKQGKIIFAGHEKN